METKKKKFAVPHTYVILIILVLICAIMTWLIPAGAYDRVEDAVTGKMVVDPNSFHLVEDEGGLGFFDVMLEFIKGMESASSIIFFIFIIGGAFTIIQDTGAMSASIHALVRKFGKKQNFILVPAMDFKKRWTDESLYDYFDLNKKERALIEATIRKLDS